MRSKKTRNGEPRIRIREPFFRLFPFLALLLCSLLPVPCSLNAQAPATTTIHDTVYKSDGSLASGSVVITWTPFVSADNKSVFGGTKTVPLTSGALQVALVPNAGATPSGTSYNVKYYQSGGIYSEETWVVPISSTSLTLSQVRVTAAPSPSVMLSSSQVSGTSIVSNPPATQTITAPATASVVPLRLKGSPTANADLFEVYDSQATPQLQGRFDSTGALIAAKAPTFSTMTPGSIQFAGAGGLLSQDNANFFYDSTAKGLLVGSALSTFNQSPVGPTIGAPTKSFFGANWGAGSGGGMVSYSQSTTGEADGIESAGLSTGANSSAVGILAGGYFDGGANTSSGIYGFYGGATIVSGSVNGESAGTLTNCINLGVGTVSDCYGLLVHPAINSGGGTITRNNGILIQDQTAGVTNFALKTGVGLVSFGDNVSIGTTFSSVGVATNIVAQGADPTGATSSTAAINSAIANSTYGGTVLIPRGAFLLNGSGTELILVNKTVHLVCDSWEGTQLVVGSSVPGTTDIIHVTAPGANANVGFTMENCQIVSQAQGSVNTSLTVVTWVSGVAFPVDGSWNGVKIAINNVLYTVAAFNAGAGDGVHELHLTGSAGTQASPVAYYLAPGKNAINLDATSGVISHFVISHNYFNPFGGNGIITTFPPSSGDGVFNGVIRDNYIRGGVNLAHGGDDLKILHNTITGVGPGITVNSVTGATTNIIEGNSITACSGGIVVNQAENLQILSNIVEPASGCAAETNSALIDILGSSGTPVKAPRIVGNQLTPLAWGSTNNTYGVRLDYATDAVIEQNDLEISLATQTLALTTLTHSIDTMFGVQSLNDNGCSCSPHPNYTNLLTDGSATTLIVTKGGNNLGIGTINPGYALTLGSGQINVPSGTASAPPYSLGDGLGGMYSYGSGNISIGYSGTILGRFDLNLGLSAQGFCIANVTACVMGSMDLGPGMVRAALFEGGTTTTSPIIYRTTSGVGTTGADHIFQVGNNGATEAMRILNNGNVGIGTAAPGSTLDVAGAIRSTLTAVTFSATPAFNSALGNSFKLTLTGNVTSSTIVNGQAGEAITLLLCQDGTGTRTMTWPANLKLAAGSFTLTTTAGKCDSVSALYDGSNWYETARALNE